MAFVPLALVGLFFPDVAAGLAFHIVRPIVATEFSPHNEEPRLVVNRDVRFFLKYALLTMCPADPDVAAGLAFHMVRPIVAAEF